MFSNKDIDQIKSKGLQIKDIENQLKNFEEGFSFINLIKPATINDGILRLTNNEIDAYTKLYDDLKPNSLKFVPASGAASRMFKFLFEFYSNANETYNSTDELKDESVRYFFANLDKFAFYKELESTVRLNNQSITDLKKQGKFKEILKYLLFEDGLNYGEKPKGVLLFHEYEKNVRTALEEHLVEGALYAKNNTNCVNIHFTISPEHETLFREILDAKLNYYEKEFNVKFNIEFSQQKSSTDMVAVDMNNRLFRNNDGSLLFRPGGHGALIENLNDLNADVIFIKNIDNVIPDKLKSDTVKYKKALAGILLSTRDQIFEYLELLESNEITDNELSTIETFIEKVLCYRFEKENDKLIYINQLKAILNRPLRVCGMVQNEGEPGGGPFWVKQENNIIDLQIIESSQIDGNNAEQNQILKNSTHFNPVDLVCCTINYKGNKFDLLQYRDLKTGFISRKSKDGKELKAQELPGLWNGAMAYWNTIFVEVPIITFNPVKTVNDLLRKEHQ